MTPATSLILFKLVLTTGLATWLTLVAFNNIRAFAGGVAAVGGMMSMQLFDQEPAIPSPLLARRVRTVGLHRLIYSFVLAIEWIVAALLWYRGLRFRRRGTRRARHRRRDRAGERRALGVHNHGLRADAGRRVVRLLHPAGGHADHAFRADRGGDRRHPRGERGLTPEKFRARVTTARARSS